MVTDEIQQAEKTKKTFTEEILQLLIQHLLKYVIYVYGTVQVNKRVQYTVLY